MKAPVSNVTRLDYYAAFGVPETHSKPRREAGLGSDAPAISRDWLPVPADIRSTVCHIADF